MFSKLTSKHVHAGFRGSEDERLEFVFIDETLRKVLKGIYRLRKVHKLRFPNLAATFSAELEQLGYRKLFICKRQVAKVTSNKRNIQLQDTMPLCEESSLSAFTLL